MTQLIVYLRQQLFFTLQVHKLMFSIIYRLGFSTLILLISLKMARALSVLIPPIMSHTITVKMMCSAYLKNAER